MYNHKTSLEVYWIYLLGIKTVQHSPDHYGFPLHTG